MADNAEVERKQCGKCKVNLPLTHFKTKRDETRSKHCIKCLDVAKAQREKSKCEHGRRRSSCKECGGGSICEHGRRRSTCKDCGGGSVCEHKRQRSTCKDCGGSSICEHKRERSKCKECGGGSVCEHKRQRSQCKDCGGGGICEHKRERSKCKECDPNGHLAHIVRNSVSYALKKDKDLSSQEYLGCNIDTFREHIEAQFEEGMTWDNHGEWHIDHIVPIKYKENGEVPSLEEVVERLHYTNTQPLWGSENMSKGNRFVG